MLPRDGTSPIDGEVHRNNMQLLQAAVACTSFDSFRMLAPGLGFNGTETFLYSEPSTFYPKWVTIDDVANNQLLILVCGISGTQMPASILSGWSTPTSLASESFPFCNVARYIVSTLRRATTGGQYDKVRLVGHSYGGAIVQIVRSKMSNMLRAGGSMTYTYGAPKPDYRGNRGSYNPNDVVRVFQDTDPVPNLPPSIEELAGYWRLLRNTEATAWNRFTQMVDGYVVLADGSMRVATNPTLKSAIDYFQTLAAWITGITAFGADVHSLLSYQRILSLVPEVNQFDPTWRTGRTHTGAASLTAVQMEERRVADLVTQGNTAAADPIGAARQAAPFITIRAGERFYPGRRNRHLCVLYGRDVVCYTRTKRARRQMVRWLNQTQLAN